MGKISLGRSATYASTTCWAAVLSFSWRSFLSLHSGSWSALSVRRNFGAFFSKPGHSRAITLRLTNQESEGQRRNLKQEKNGPSLCKPAKRKPPNEPGHFPFLVAYRFSFDNSAGWPKSRGPR